jgi:hypothetical protein
MKIQKQISFPRYWMTCSIQNKHINWKKLSKPRMYTEKLISSCKRGSKQIHNSAKPQTQARYQHSGESRTPMLKENTTWMAGLETRTREAPMPAKASFQLPSVSVARKPFDFPKVLVCIRADAVSKGYTLSKQSTWSAHYSVTHHKFHDRDANCRQNYSWEIGNFKQKRVRPRSALWASFLGTEMGGSQSNSQLTS